MNWPILTVEGTKVNSPTKTLADLKVHSLPAPVLIRAAALVCLLGAGTVLAQDHNPFAGNAEAAKRGEFHFRINCAFCHGLGARGGGRGPDLTRTQKRHGNSDAELFTTINQGVPGTAMPPNGTTGQGVGMTEEEVWDVITYIRSVQLKAPAQPAGNALHGKQLFYGDANCSGCHMVEGKGGRLGPDLTAVGMARATDAIVDSVRNPSRRLAPGLLEATKEFPQEYETVTVVTAQGQEIKGVTMNEDNFGLQVMDTSEQIRLFEKDKLRSIKKSRTSMMPIYGAALLSDKDLQDIVAYLQSVGGK
ncbi:MAG TPA: c-type cytochrome [Terriglobales bacterium]|jgi:cytochrome c oxidase cbb3-type subunit 3|nr:c-type cytochrome [Terriglobales bacterium]